MTTQNKTPSMIRKNNDNADIDDGNDEPGTKEKKNT